jgi:hypothetical protein
MHVTQESPITDVAPDVLAIALLPSHRLADQLLGMQGLLSNYNSGLSQ